MTMETMKIAALDLVCEIAKLANSHEDAPVDLCEASDALDELIAKAREILNG